MSTFDFSTLYTKIPHDKVRTLYIYIYIYIYMYICIYVLCIYIYIYIYILNEITNVLLKVG